MKKMSSEDIGYKVERTWMVTLELEEDDYWRFGMDNKLYRTGHTKKVRWYPPRDEYKELLIYDNG